MEPLARHAEEFRRLGHVAHGGRERVFDRLALEIGDRFGEGDDVHTENGCTLLSDVQQNSTWPARFEP